MRKFPVSTIAVLLVVLAAGGAWAQASPANRDLDSPVSVAGISDTLAGSDWRLHQSGWPGGDPALTSFAAAAAGSGHVRLDHQTVTPTPAAASAPQPERFAMTLAGLGALGLVSRRRLRHT